MVDEANFTHGSQHRTLGAMRFTDASIRRHMAQQRDSAVRTNNFYFTIKPEGLKITRHLLNQPGVYAKLELSPVDPAFPIHCPHVTIFRNIEIGQDWPT